MKIKLTFLITFLLLLNISIPISGTETIFKYDVNASFDADSLKLSGEVSVKIPVQSVRDSKLLLIRVYGGPERAKRFVYYPPKNFESDPIFESWYDSWTKVKRVRLNNKEIPRFILQKTGPYITVPVKEIDECDEIAVRIKFETYFFNCIENTIITTDAFPAIVTTEQKDFAYFPSTYTCKIELPVQYELISSGYKTQTITQGDRKIVYIEDPDAGYNFLILSKNAKLVRESNEPFLYRLYSISCNYSEDELRKIESDISHIYTKFGLPVGNRHELNIVLLPLRFPGLGGGTMGNLIIVNKLYLSSTLYSSIFNEDIFLHELLHYWWSNRFFAPVKEDDGIFIECFNEMLTEFLSNMRGDNNKRKENKTLSERVTKKLLSGKKEQLELIKLARGGYHFSVLRSKNADVFDRINKGTEALRTMTGFYPREKWLGFLTKYFDAIKDGGEFSFDLFCDVNSELKRVLESWLVEENDVDYALSSINVSRNGRLWKSDIQITNKGGVFCPCPIYIEFEDGSKITDTITVWGKDTVLTIESPSKVKYVKLDPNHIIPDIDRLNNKNSNKLRLVFNRFSPDEESYQLNIMPFSIPGYSEESGLTYWSGIVFSGPARSYGVAGRGRKNTLNLMLGYNFKGERKSWLLSYRTPLSFPVKKSFIKLVASDSPEKLEYMVNIKLNWARNFKTTPLHSVSLFARHDRFWLPSYRNRINWTTGTNFSAGASYKYNNIKSLLYPTKGVCISISGSKGFTSLDGRWNYEKLMFSMYGHILLPKALVLDSRIFLGNIWGYAPIQERVDLARDALFVSYPIYERTGYRLLAQNSAVRIRKRIPIFDILVFCNNAWLENYGSGKLKYLFEVGAGLRMNNPLSASLNFVFLRRNLQGEMEKGLLVQFHLGLLFEYSPITLRGRI